MRRDRWDFPYEPVAPATAQKEGGPLDVVVALAQHVEPGTLAEALHEVGEVEVHVLLDEAPLHWFRVRSAAPASRLDVAGLLDRARLRVRYVASARRGSMSLAPRLDFPREARRRPTSWTAKAAQAVPDPVNEGGRWFLGPHGVHVNRDVCGTGAGARLAVVDDDATDVEQLELERLVAVGVDEPSSASGHGALMVGWAVGARRRDGTAFIGVAPDASVRMYCIPKPGEDIVSFPLALVRAVLDGADVIVCATYLESTSSPMLDDALEVAAHLGRQGRGTPVVLPTGRETSSPGTSLHASLSLAFGDPASDPRAHCVAPSGRAGGWFLWRDSRGKLRPFANRGPAVRWLAPGDDLAYPFASRDRLFHAESSGASAVAAGVIALVLARNPRLRLHELHGLLARTVEPPEESNGFEDGVVADPADLLPTGRDRDGHDAKCGYGRLDATRACASACDPVSLALAAIGEDDAAQAWCTRVHRPYSGALARWAVRALLGRPDIEHAVRAVVRHARLVGRTPSRARSHARGALARQLGVIVRELASRPGAPRAIRDELEGMLERLRQASEGPDATLELEAGGFFARLWPAFHPPVSGQAVLE